MAVAKYLSVAEALARKWKLPSGANYMNTKSAPVQKCAVIGGGVMGQRIVVCLLSHGYRVNLVDVSPTVLAKAASAVSKDVPKAAHLFSKSTSLESVADADLVIEAVFESLPLKKQVFAQLNNLCKPDAILATNTSTLDIDEIGSLVAEPGRVVGMHFFTPADRVRLVEVIYGKNTSARSLATVFDVGVRCAKLPVVMKSGPGFCGNRMFSPYLCQTCHLIEEGLLPDEIDAAVCRFGFAIGPFKTMDMIGMDTMLRIKKEQNWPFPTFVEEMVDSGRLGRKSGRGWYLYEADGRRRVDTPFFERLQSRYPPRTATKRSDTEILNLALFPLIAEGFRLLEDGIMHRPQDIDLVWVHGYGWPAQTGGPLRFAGSYGLMQIFTECMRQYERTHLEYWRPCQLMYDVAKLKPAEYDAWLAKDFIETHSSKL